MASGAAQTFRHSLQAVLKGQHGFDDESQYNILAMAGSKLNGNSRDHTQIFQGLLSGALNELMTQQPSTSSSLQAASTQHVLPVQTALAEITRHQELAQQHVSKASQANKDPAPWAVQVASQGSISSAYTAAKRLQPYRRHLKAHSRSQKPTKCSNSKKRPAAIERGRGARKCKHASNGKLKLPPHTKPNGTCQSSCAGAASLLKAVQTTKKVSQTPSRDSRTGLSDAHIRSRTLDTCHSLQALVSLKVQKAAPLVLKARRAMMKTPPQNINSARSPENALLASRKLQFKKKRAKQRLMKLQRRQWAHGVVTFSSKIKLQTQNSDAKRRWNAEVLQWHQETQEQARLAKEAAARERLATLKSNDVQAYLKLVQSAKNSRLSQLLKQTDACLNKLAGRLTAKGRCPGPGPAAPGVADAAAHAGDTALQDSSEQWSQIAAGFGADISQQPALLQGGELRDYQVKGLQWLVGLHDNRLNGILADEMGLGKTIQIIALVAYLVQERRTAGPFMVVAPSSLIANWEQEFKHWAPSLKLVSYKGSAEARAAMFAQQIGGGKASFNVLLTSYDFMMGKTDRPCLAKLTWEYIIIDEGHRLKNAGCKLNAEIKMYTTRSRLLLTGTPVQNKLEELWSLLNFLMPSLFGSSEEFQQWFAAPVKSKCMMEEDQSDESAMLDEEESLLVTNRLHQVLRPFMLRRLKESVATELSPKVERLVPCQLSAYQTALCGLIEGEVQASEGGTASKALKRINNTLMELRTICNHPLVSRLHPEGGESQLSVHPLGLPAEVSLCGKTEVLDRVLVKLIAAGHKVLLFSTMTRVLDVLEDYLDWRGFEHLRLDGAVSSADRGDLVHKFNEPGSSASVFLLSMRAGGVGLNLQAADTVIMYDTDWNPQVDLQAQARAHRIGQKREVLVLRLQTLGSVEERILEASSQKRSLADRSITGGFFDGKTGADERRQYLLDLFKRSAQQQAADTTEGALSNSELNGLIARGDSELQLFEKWDAKDACNPGQGVMCHQVQVPQRLASLEAVAGLVAEARVAAEVKDADEGKEFGRGKRVRRLLRSEE